MRLMRTLLFVLLLPLITTVHAFELGTYFELSNLDYARSRGISATELPGDIYLWGLRVTGHDELSDQLSLDLSFASDPILRNVGSTLITYSDRFFSIQLGPFFGIMNAPDTLLQSGLSTTVTLFIPGVTVMTLRADNSLTGRLVVVGDYIQEQSELSVGFFVPNAIPTAYIRTKRYTWKTETGEAVDTMTAYGLETDIFQKNIPYRVLVDFSYHDVSRSFVQSTTTVQSYGALILGTDISVELFDRLTLRLDLESSIYTFGRDALMGAVSADRFLFRMSSGLSYGF